MHPPNTKERIVAQLTALLDAQMSAAQAGMAEAKEARDSESKSSAGDKYETGREMMQMEMDKHALQWQKAVQLRHELATISLLPHPAIGLGSLVIAPPNRYFLSVGMGAVVLDGTTYYAISPASPIGRLLMGKKAGEVVVFQGKNIVIEAVD